MLLLAVLLAGAAPTTCANAPVLAAAKSAADALNRRDLAAARAATAPVVSCPIQDGPTYAAHVLAADVATQDGNWAQVRALLADAGMHPETTLAARAQFLRLRADQGLADADAFAADRSLTLIANDARLTAGGAKLETFRVPGGEVTAYRTPLDQGGLHRVIEFVATPDDKAAYPVTIMLTDDVQAVGIMQVLNKGEPAAAHA